MTSREVFHKYIYSAQGRLWQNGNEALNVLTVCRREWERMGRNRWSIARVIDRVKEIYIKQWRESMSSMLREREGRDGQGETGKKQSCAYLKILATSLCYPLPRNLFLCLFSFDFLYFY